MSEETIVDAGPLVAFLNRPDNYHAWAVARMSEREPPFVTCEAVLSEACFLLREDSRGPDALMELVERGTIRVDLRIGLEDFHIRQLLSRYADVPMSLADACLVRLTELRPRSRVLTLVSDFLTYRRNGRQVIPVICPEDVRQRRPRRTGVRPN